MDSATLVRQARQAAGLTQTELARRLGKAQATIAALERSGANPTVGTLDRVLRATGHRLELRAPAATVSLDEAQVRAQLRLSPAERADAHDRAYRNIRGDVATARRVP